MKLYLSSYHLGDKPQMLSELIGNNKRIAIIPNALDIYPDSPRKQNNLQREIDDLKNLGLEPEILDLKEYFGKSDNLTEKLQDFGSVWVIGGNTFTLRRAYKESGMDAWLQNNRENGEFVYGGYSAGVCVLSPSLKGLETVDQPNIVPEGYNNEIVWDGVGLVSFAFAPHYMSNHPESESVNKEVDFYQKNGIEYKALRDGEALVMEIA